MFLDKVLAMNLNALIDHWGCNELTPPSMGYNGNIGAEVNTVQWGAPGIHHSKGAVLFDGINSGLDILSTAIQQTFNGGQGSISFFARAANDSVWVDDGTNRWLFNLYVDENNYIRIIKPAGVGDNKLQFVYKSASDSLVRNKSVDLGTDWFHLGMSWDATTGELEFYVNGLQDNTNFIITQAMAGALVYATIGTETAFGRNSWLGPIAEFTLWNEALPPEQFKALSQYAQDGL